jgi:phage terminase Nu1 subunit (DNA packaging protein)
LKVNRAQLAEIFGVSKTTIDAWRRKGCPVEAQSGRGKAIDFDTVKVLGWYLEMKAGQHNDYSGLLEYEKYRKIKRENDLEENKYAPVSVITDALNGAANQIVPIMESLPLVIKRNWPEVTGDQIMLVKKSISECMNAIADLYGEEENTNG